MLEVPQPPKGWNRHHTLYYRRWYQQGGDRRLAKWRGNAVMIMPMDADSHADLHRHVPPQRPTTNMELVDRALEVCSSIERQDSATYTHYEAFNEVRDELYELYKQNLVSNLGREALRYVDFFDKQLKFMEEIPQIS